MTLDAAFPVALWAFSDTTGIRPEWIVPVLYSESGLNPAQPNAQGYPYYGLNQISAKFLSARGIAPADYLTWPASAQLTRVVAPYMNAQQSAFGALRSGTRVYQSNFLPATLKTATSLDSVIATQTHPCTGGRTNDVYCANSVFDYQKKGTITVGDLAHFVSKAAGNTYVQRVIASAYAARPGEKETDPVYGLDFGAPAQPGGLALPQAAGGGLVLFAAFVALAWAASGAPMTLRGMRRAIA
jgi:hypothetical protein